MAITVPIYDPNRGFRLWLLSEIYDNSEAGGQYVPNVNDMVWDWEIGHLRVTQVDVTTCLSTLVRWQAPSNNANITDEDILTGAVPGRVGENYRIYVNAAYDPVVACIDSRLTIYGTEQSYVRIFQGSDISENGKVVSLYHSVDGRLIDDKWPLETVVISGESKPAIKVPKNGHLVKGLDDGELLTCVVYTNAGYVSSINPLLVKNTNYVRAVNAPKKHIVSIALESPFQTPANPKRLEVPLHLPVDSLNLVGKVIYSDGSSRIVPIDGIKMELVGLETFTISQSGQTIPLVLIYHMAPEESSYNVTSDNGGALTERYSLTTIPAMNAYSVKLFVVPTWNYVRSQWKLNYWLCNLERDIMKDVTGLVEVGTDGSLAYDPLLYGTVQRLTVAIDMNTISADYHPFRHVQTFDLSLFSSIGEATPNWTIRYTPGSGEIYGEDVIIGGEISPTGVSLDLGSNFEWDGDWLQSYYRDLYPLFNPHFENSPLEPTHVQVWHGDVFIELLVAEYLNRPPLACKPMDGDTLILKWLHKTEFTEALLAVGPATFRYID